MTEIMDSTMTLRRSQRIAKLHTEQPSVPYFESSHDLSLKQTINHDVEAKVYKQKKQKKTLESQRPIFLKRSHKARKRRSKNKTKEPLNTNSTSQVTPVSPSKTPNPFPQADITDSQQLISSTRNQHSQITLKIEHTEILSKVQHTIIAPNAESIIQQCPDSPLTISPQNTTLRQATQIKFEPQPPPSNGTRTPIIKAALPPMTPSKNCVQTTPEVGSRKPTTRAAKSTPRKIAKDEVKKTPPVKKTIKKPRKRLLSCSCYEDSTVFLIENLPLLPLPKKRNSFLQRAFDLVCNSAVSLFSNWLSKPPQKSDVEHSITSWSSQNPYWPS